MMFSTLVSFAAMLALPLLAVATPAGVARGASTATTACCISTESATSPAGVALLGLLGIAVQSVIGSIGVGCSPLTVVGIASGSCNTNTVSCTNVVNHGIGIGCIPISL